MASVFLLFALTCTACSRTETVSEESIVYEEVFGVKKFSYVTDNTGKIWTKDVLLCAGVGMFKSMEIPKELHKIRDKLIEERDSKIIIDLPK